MHTIYDRLYYTMWDGYSGATPIPAAVFDSRLQEIYILRLILNLIAEEVHNA
jgi:hypothetical protein